MRHTKTIGIVLKTSNIFEQDRSVLLFTSNHGKIITYAKGSRKITSRRNSHFEFLNIGQFDLYSTKSEKIIITQCETIKTHSHIKENFYRFSLACFIVEITDKLCLKDENLPEIFNLLKLTLTLLDEEKEPQIILASYIVKFLTHLGLLPDFETIALKKEDRGLNTMQKYPLSRIADAKVSEEIRSNLLRKTNELLKQYIEFETIKSARFIEKNTNNERVLF